MLKPKPKNLVKFTMGILLLLAITVIILRMSLTFEFSKPKIPRPITQPAIAILESSRSDSSRKLVLDIKNHSLTQLQLVVPDLPTNIWTTNIHLCINFNLHGMKPNQEAVELLIKYYYPLFRNITILFDRIYERPNYLPDYVDFMGCNSSFGVYQQRCLMECLRRGNKDTVGHLYIADDMFINITMMGALDRSKIWFVQISVKSYDAIVKNVPDGWRWWTLLQSAEKLVKILSLIPPEWKEQLIKTAGFPDKFQAYATGDMVYVSSFAVDKFMEVLDFSAKNIKDFLFALAIPLAVNIAGPDRETLGYGYLWGDRSIGAIKKTAKVAPFVHPVKLTNKEHASIWIKYMEQQLLNAFST